MSTPSTIERNDEVQVHPPVSPEPPGKERRRRWWVWLLVVAVLAYGAYRIRKGMVAPQAATVSAPGSRPGRDFGAVPVVAVQATKGDIGVYFTGLGAVTPIHTVAVKSQIAGYLMQVLYKEGQIIQQGDALAEIDPRPYQVMLENAEAGLLRDQANLDNAKVDLKRYQTLVPVRAVPEQQLATQEALVKSYEGVVKADQAQIDTAKLDLVYCHITAPITGRVGLRLVDPGNYVTPTDATGLVVITQIQPISVIFTLPEDQLPAIMQQMNLGARLRVDAYDREMKKIAQGWLETIDNQIDPTTGTFKLRANFDNRDGVLFPNQFVNCKLLVEEKHGVTLVPTAVVQRNSQRTYVFLVKPDSTVTVKTITIGTTEGDESEVTSGLAPGDDVVMTGVDRLQEGTKVRFQRTKTQ
ncbi:MAG TPA: efflux RND transporter periplasmic adaptor subunit [Terriglobia bacterium]|nr:efflux RND transporter periplasmic adaptor subunit [Terriglobia bacterium]